MLERRWMKREGKPAKKSEPGSPERGTMECLRMERRRQGAINNSPTGANLVRTRNLCILH